MRALQAHLRGHSGQKPYKCIECDVRFVRKGDRTKHEDRVHRSSRPFYCTGSGCREAYATRYQLNRHLAKSPEHACLAAASEIHATVAKDPEAVSANVNMEDSSGDASDPVPSPVPSSEHERASNETQYVIPHYTPAKMIQDTLWTTVYFDSQDTDSLGAWAADQFYENALASITHNRTASSASPELSLEETHPSAYDRLQWVDRKHTSLELTQMSSDTSIVPRDRVHGAGGSGLSNVQHASYGSTATKTDPRTPEPVSVSAMAHTQASPDQGDFMEGLSYAIEPLKSNDPPVNIKELLGLGTEAALMMWRDGAITLVNLVEPVDREQSPSLWEPETVTNDMRGLEKLVEHLATTIVNSRALYESVEVSIDLEQLYADLANKIRRCRSINSDALKRTLNILIQESIEQGVRKRDEAELRCVKQFWEQWEICYAFAQESGRPNEDDLETLGNRIPTAKKWYDVIQEHEQAERERWREHRGLTHLQHVEQPTPDGAKIRLDAAVHRQIRSLIQEQRQQPRLPVDQKNDKLSVEWIKDSLRAAFAANEYCKTIVSGRTDSVLESVYPSSRTNGSVIDDPGAKSRLCQNPVPDQVQKSAESPKHDSCMDHVIIDTSPLVYEDMQSHGGDQATMQEGLADVARRFQAYYQYYKSQRVHRVPRDWKDESESAPIFEFPQVSQCEKEWVEWSRDLYERPGSETSNIGTTFSDKGITQ